MKGTDDGMALKVAALLSCFATAMAVVGPLEICERETLEANCNADEVISVSSAEYGRMTLWRCVSKDYGLVGCAVDVTSVLRGLCSGKRKCSVTGSHSALVDAKTTACDKDLAAYLVVSYECLKVVTGTRRSCSTRGYNPLPPTSGLISTNQVSDSGYGGPNCPWRLQPTSGEQYNVTMTTYGAAEGAVECSKVLEVREGDDRQEVVLCAKDLTTKTVHVTQGDSSVDLVILSEGLAKDRRVLVRYEALECLDPDLPPEAFFSRRTSHEGQVTCKETGEAWVVRCEGGQWTGRVGKCGGKKIFGSDKRSPYAFLVIVVVGTVVGMLIGGSLLCLIVWAFRRCRRWRSNRRQRTPSFRFDDYLTYTSHLQKTALWNDVPSRTTRNWLDLGHATLPRDIISPPSDVSHRPEYASLPRDVTLRRSSYSSLPREPPVDPRAPRTERRSVGSVLEDCREGNEEELLAKEEEAMAKEEGDSKEEEQPLKGGKNAANT